jgi:Carboxypeptidase regulatory-like domain/TonB dependent receptor
MTHILSRLISLVAATCVAICFALPILAQATSGSILGQVKDPSQAAIAGVVVTAKNEATGLEQRTQTDANGDYILSNLSPGSYTINISKTGFKSLARGPIKLLVDQKLRLDLELSVGEISEVIRVTNEAPLLQTQSADTGEVIQSRQILDLPLLGRNFLELALLNTGTTSGAGGNNVNIAVNGQREFANSIMVDGIEVTGNRNNDTSLRPSVDSVEEFKVVTSAYAPEFGRAAGAVISIQTKSGTNDLHGSLYEFFRPNSTAARTFFSEEPAALKQHNFGGTIGAPIINDKTFFFGSYEGMRLRDAFSYLDTVPPSNQIRFLPNGDVDLSGLIDPMTGTQIPIFDPEFFATNFYAQQFPGNVIPADRVSPAGKAVLLNLFPAPTLPGTSNGWYNNIVARQYYKYDYNSVDLRIDHTFSPRDRIAGVYHYVDFDSLLGDRFAGQIPIDSGGDADEGDTYNSRNQSVGITGTHLFPRNWIGEFRFGYTRARYDQLSLLDGRNVADELGIRNVNIPGFQQTSGLPHIFLAYGASTGGSTYKPLFFTDNNYQLAGSFSGRIGTHDLKTGVEYRRLSARPDFSLFPTGYQYYGGAYSSLTGDPNLLLPAPDPDNQEVVPLYRTGGSEIADLLLGLPLTVSLGLQLTHPETATYETHFYGQDSWKVNNRLVLMYGVRYEYQAPYVERSDLASNYDLVSNRILLAGRGNNSRSLIRADKNNFAPRFGFALRLTDRTVLRGGYGIYYSPENDARSDVLTKNFPFAVRQEFYNDIYGGLPFPYVLDNGVTRITSFPLDPNMTGLAPADIPQANQQSVFFVDPNFRTGYSQLFNLVLQRELTSTLSIEAGYVGSLSRKLSYAVGDINRGNRVTTEFGRIEAQFSEGSGSYHSLQVKANKRLARGFSMLASYTFGKNMDNGPAPFNLGSNFQQPQDPYRLDLERALSAIDVKHNLVVSYIYELPFGKGKRFLGNLRGVTQGILGGWQINGIFQARSGQPVNVVRNSELRGFEGLRPNLSRNPNLNRSERTLERYFDIDAFDDEGLGQNDMGAAGRNLIRGPGFVNFDFSTFKNFALTERAQLQLRFEFFNLTNTPHFANPNSDKAEGDFGSITRTIGNPRIIQFAAKIKF